MRMTRRAGWAAAHSVRDPSPRPCRASELHRVDKRDPLAIWAERYSRGSACLHSRHGFRRLSRRQEQSDERSRPSSRKGAASPRALQDPARACGPPGRLVGDRVEIGSTGGGISAGGDLAFRLGRAESAHCRRDQGHEPALIASPRCERKLGHAASDPTWCAAVVSIELPRRRDRSGAASSRYRMPPLQQCGKIYLQRDPLSVPRTRSRATGRLHPCPPARGAAATPRLRGRVAAEPHRSQARRDPCHFDHGAEASLQSGRAVAKPMRHGHTSGIT